MASYPKVGDVFSNNSGEVCTVVKYTDSRNVEVIFDQLDETVQVFSSFSLFRGRFKNRLSPSVHGVGYIGIGSYNSSSEGEETKPYSMWYSMLARCYSKSSLRHSPSYLGHSVSDTWLNFQNFAKWLDTPLNVLGLSVGFALDKDLLSSNSKEYSARSCCLLPVPLNNFLEYPSKTNSHTSIYTGVHFRKDRSKWSARCRDPFSKKVHIGTFKTELEAAQAYKETKERYAKELAEHYKDQIDPRAYEALLKYEVIFPD